MDNIKEAAKLAHWLIVKKGMKPKTAYIIAANKYKIHPLQRSLISKERQKLKPVQEELL